MDEAVPVRTPADRHVLAAFTAEYDGGAAPRDALFWLAHPGERAPSGAVAPDAAARAARTALYRPGVSADDRCRALALAEAAQAEARTARAALERASRVVAARAARRRRRAAALGAGLVLAAVGAAALLLPREGATPAPAAAPSASARLALGLDRLPAPWSLSSLVARGDRLDGRTTLRMFRSVTGARFLLVVACPAEDAAFHAVVLDEGRPIGPALSGGCGRRAITALPLERGVGELDVLVTTEGGRPFAAAVVRREAPGAGE